jgi:hypothetical protein
MIAICLMLIDVGIPPINLSLASAIICGLQHSFDRLRKKALASGAITVN